ncbi:MAG: Fe-S cluster assembly ATPase SufC [bacterium]|nr:Fe-S cluster assembly ATPase SufC [bacterium]
MSSSLVITQLHTSIDSKEILKGISLTVKPGEIHAVMGPNGSGKSTLAYTLAGHPAYEIPSNQEGMSVTMDGEDLLEMSPDERSKAGLFLAFQYPIEIPGVKVQNFLRLAYNARFAHDESKKFPSVLAFRQHLESLADELQVKKELLKRGLNEGFSGGEKKRLEILQMAVLEPKYAILDETDSGLDIDAIKAVAEGVKKVVAKYNTGIIIITHYQRILDYINPDKVHVLVDGKISKSGDFSLVSELEKKGYQQ